MRSGVTWILLHAISRNAWRGEDSVLSRRADGVITDACKFVELTRPEAQITIIVVLTFA